jgi:glutamate-1-semialdehyde 2,1-aminomutase
MVEHGIYLARRGFIVLSMPIGTEEIERFIVVFGRFLDRYTDILRTGQVIAH